MGKKQTFMTGVKRMKLPEWLLVDVASSVHNPRHRGCIQKKNEAQNHDEYT
jgi:hypothetical protein